MRDGREEEAEQGVVEKGGQRRGVVAWRKRAVRTENVEQTKSGILLRQFIILAFLPRARHPAKRPVGEAHMFGRMEFGGRTSLTGGIICIHIQNVGASREEDTHLFFTN